MESVLVGLGLHVPWHHLNHVYKIFIGRLAGKMFAKYLSTIYVYHPYMYVRSVQKVAHIFCLIYKNICYTMKFPSHSRHLSLWIFPFSQITKKSLCTASAAMLITYIYIYIDNILEHLPYLVNSFKSQEKTEIQMKLKLVVKCMYIISSYIIYIYRFLEIYVSNFCYTWCKSFYLMLF